MLLSPLLLKLKLNNLSLHTNENRPRFEAGFFVFFARCASIVFFARLRQHCACRLAAHRCFVWLSPKTKNSAL